MNDDVFVYGEFVTEDAWYAGGLQQAQPAEGALATCLLWTLLFFFHHTSQGFLAWNPIKASSSREASADVSSQQGSLFIFPLGFCVLTFDYTQLHTQISLYTKF